MMRVISIGALGLLAGFLLAFPASPATQADGPVSGPPGVIETYAGGGTDPDVGAYRLDAQMYAHRIAFSADDTLHYSDISGVIRSVVNDEITHVAGGGEHDPDNNEIGDGGPAVDARLQRPSGIAFDDADNLFIADAFNCAVREVDAATGLISTIAGSGPMFCGETDGGPATQQRLYIPEAVEVVGDELYIADRLSCRILHVDGTGFLSRVAGDSTCQNTGDGGPAVSAGIAEPWDVEVAPNGDVYFAAGCTIRRISQGVITSLKGFASCDRYPYSIEFDALGNLFVGYHNCGITMIAEGVETAVAGSHGNCDLTGDGGLAKDALTQVVPSLAVDSAGNLFLNDMDPTGAARLPQIRVIYGAAADSDGDGYMDAAEANIGQDHTSYCITMRADVNRDSRVNSIDLGRIASQWGTPQWPRLDQNADGIVNSIDLGITASRFNQYVQDC